MSRGIDHISDTAAWVAHYRAMESARPDALFHDPLAARFAGRRGEEIMRAMPRGAAFAWAIVVRTKLIDDALVGLIAREGVDTVLSLAAGLDGRPWRLPLPPALRWIEVDLPPLLAAKAAQLGGETPRCAYESIGLDLTDQPTRQALFAKLAGRRVLALTEGLLGYLDSAAVEALGRDLHAAGFPYWMFELVSPRVRRQSARRFNRALSSGAAKLQFGPEGGSDWFRPLGWEEVEFHSFFAAAGRLQRQPWYFPLARLLMRLSPGGLARADREAGIVVVRRTQA